MTPDEAIDLARQLLDSEAERLSDLVHYHDKSGAANGPSVEHFRALVEERRTASKILKEMKGKNHDIR